MKQTEKRTVLRLEGSHSIIDAEEMLEQIDEAEPDTDLLSSTDLTDRHFAGTAAHLQLLISWRRQCPQGRLRVHVQNEDDDSQAKTVLERFLETDHGVLAFALAGTVWTRGGTRDLTALAKPFLHRRLEEMDHHDSLPWRGAKLYAMCLDESSGEAPRILYRPREGMTREPEVIGVSGFTRLAEQISRRLEKGAGGGSLGRTGSLSSMLFELFRNTHRWARSDVRNQPYGPRSSARGFRVERHDLNLSEEEKMVKPLPPLREFFAHPQLKPQGDRRRFAEVTIFDSGPGVAARRVLETTESEPIDLGKEHTALRECLQKHMTTSGVEEDGKGLHRVLEDLTSLDAFLWLRCGRLSLYRDFLAHPYQPKDRQGEPFLLDWTGGIGGVTEVPPAAGSFFTALIPIGNDPRQKTLFPSDEPH